MELIVKTDTRESIRIHTIEELDSILVSTHERLLRENPIIATVEYPHNCRVDIGLGDSFSIVIIWPDWLAETASSYFVSLSNERMHGTKWFWLHGTADTEIDQQHLIPVKDALQIVADFVQTGMRSTCIHWQEQYY